MDGAIGFLAVGGATGFLSPLTRLISMGGAVGFLSVGDATGFLPPLTRL